MANSNNLPDEMKEMAVEEKTNKNNCNCNNCNSIKWNDLIETIEKLTGERGTNGKNWNNLPFEMKELVVKEMTYETRTRLKMCSTSDKYLVESVKMNYDKVKIYAAKKEQYSVVSIILRKTNNPQLKFSLEMHAHTSGPVAGRFSARRNQKKKIISCSSGEDAEEMLNRFFDNIVFDRNLRADFFDINMDLPGFLDGREFTIHPKKVSIKGSDVSQFVGWLKNMSPRDVESVMVEYKLGVVDAKIDGLGTIPVIMKAHTLHIDHETDINDDQFANFNSNDIRLFCQSNITGKGINQFIKKAIANDYPVGSYLEVFDKNLYSDIELRTWNDVIEGLDVKLIYERDDFDEEDGQEMFGEREGHIQMNQGKRLEVILDGDNSEIYVRIV